MPIRTGKSVWMYVWKDETVWLTQAHMAELFGKAKSTINEHIKNVFAEGELIDGEVMKKFGISEFHGM
jgi:hypothetical protein